MFRLLRLPVGYRCRNVPEVHKLQGLLFQLFLLQYVAGRRILAKVSFGKIPAAGKDFVAGCIQQQGVRLSRLKFLRQRPLISIQTIHRLLQNFLRYFLFRTGSPWLSTSSENLDCCLWLSYISLRNFSLCGRQGMRLHFGMF